MKTHISNIRGHLMSGVSYILPLIITASLLIGIPLLIAMIMGVELSEQSLGFSRALYLISESGWMGLQLINVVLAGYIAYSIADKPAMAGGFIGGALATHFEMGFLGAILAGMVAGYSCESMKKHLKFEGVLGQMTPLFILPAVAAFAVSIVIGVILSAPLSALNQSLVTWIQSMSESGKSPIILAVVLGAMIASDLGGPINKAAWLACNLLMVDGVFLPTVLAQIAIIIPTLGYALATFIYKRRFSEELLVAGKSNLVLAVMGITEGAIPFTMAQPLILVPVNILAGIIGSVLGAVLGLNASIPPIGGMLGALSMNKAWAFLVAILLGSLFIALISPLLVDFKKTSHGDNEWDDIEISIEESF